MLCRPQSRRWVWLLFSLIVHFARSLAAPTHLSGDAPRVALYALDFLRRGVWPFYIYSMFAPNPLLVYLQAPTFVVFGFTEAALQGLTAFASALAFPAIYLASREVFADQGWRFARRAGVIAMLGLALSPFFNVYYTLGDETALLPVMELMVVAACWRGLRQGRWSDFGLAGVLLGLSQYSYIVARVFPLALSVALFLALWPKRQALTHGRGLALMVLTFIVLTLPQWLLFLSAPYTFFARASQVPNQFDLRVVLGIKLINQLMTLGVYWEVPHIPYLRRPMLNPVLSVGLLLAAAAMFRSRRASQIFVASIAAVMLVPDLLTFESLFPSANRLTGAVPFIFMLAGMGCATVWQWLETRPHLPAWAGSSVLVAVLLAGAENQWDFTYRVVPRINAVPGYEWQTPLIEIAEADYIAAHRDSGVLLPSSEYQRASLSFLLANYFPERAGGLKPPLTLGESVGVVSAAAPNRATFEGPPAGYLPDEWVLLKNGVAYFLPPLPASIEPAGNPYPIFARNGVVAAYAFPARWAGRQPQIKPTSASFQNGLDLVGYYTTDLLPGQPITITLYWQPRYPLPDDIQIFTQILDRNGGIVAGIHDWPLHGVYRAHAWRPGEVIPLSYRFAIPADTPAGAYQLITGVFDLIHQTRVPTVTGEDAATVATFKIPLAPDPSTPAHTLDAHLGNAIRLSGYTLEAAPGGLQAALYWQARATPEADYTVFVHVVDAAGNIVAQSDSQPLDGQYPTSIWSLGEIIVERRIIQAPPGDYQVFVGLYRWETLERLPVTLNGQRLPDDRLLLGAIHVSH